MTRTFETVIFKLLPGTDEAAFLATVPATTDFLRRQPGFISRRLSRGADGEWLDCAEWESLATAKAAAETFCAAPTVQPFLKAIDMSAASMRHSDVLVSVG